jgi:hypothetical protein
MTRNSITHTIIIGEGWGALAAVGFLATNPANSGETITWISGTGSRNLPPLPFLEAGRAAQGWSELLKRLMIIDEQPQTGHYLREFRNKSFSRAPWHKAPTFSDRIQVRDEMIWPSEARFTPAFEARFEFSFGELEEKIREKIHTLENVKHLTGVPVTGFEQSDDGISVILASGEKISGSRAIFADRWSSLIGMEGLPKGNALNRNRAPFGLLQAEFRHSHAISEASMQEAFYSLMHKDPGEEDARSVWGYFMDEGKRSIWSVTLAEDECEDNHSIAKKLRRIKQTLDRMFTGSEWLPENVKTFMDTVVSEQVRFEEACVFSKGDVLTEAQTLPKTPNLTFITDGFGPSASMLQVLSLLGSELGIALEEMGTMPQNENTDLVETSAN